MKNFVWMMAVVLLAAAAAFAEVDGRPYLRISGGGAWINESNVSAPGVNTTVDYDPGFVFSAAAGSRLENTPVRLEAEISTWKNDMQPVTVSGTKLDGGITLRSLMLNLYTEWRNETRLTPYGMAGAGIATAEAVLTDDVSKDTVAAGQAGVGLDVELIDSLSLDLELRYFRTSNAHFENTQADLSGFRFAAGLRYVF